MDRPARTLCPDEDKVTVAETRMWYLIAYDVRDPVRLRRVAKHLKGYGTRIQFSVFRCRLSQRQVARLDWELKKIMDTEDDLLVIGLCSGCVSRLKQKNTKQDWTIDNETYDIV